VLVSAAEEVQTEFTVVLKEAASKLAVVKMVKNLQV
jgi:ribosomal protein L7/L12